ncbi:high mobility group [Mucor circinelloides]
MNMNQVLLSPESTTIELAPITEMTCPFNKLTNSNHPPAFLEPVPITENYRCDGAFVPRIFSAFNANLKDIPSLVPSSASSISSDASSPSSPLSNVNSFHQQACNNNTSQIPCRHASLLQSIQPKPNTVSKCPVAHRPSLPFNGSRNSNNVALDASGLPLSPTMMAASAAAAAASAQNHTGSIVENTFLNSLSLSSDDDNSRKRQRLNDDEGYTMAHTTATTTATTAPSSPSTNFNSSESSFARVSFMVHGAKRTCPIGADQRMFLTKNAHIKRPRNAWIHFRCHYGQALKSQDPTLRAEEISKRASRRWARLSENEKKPWHDLAEQDKQAHKAAFPGYRYCPRRSNTASMIASQNAAKNQQQQDDAVYKSISSRV